MKNNSAIFQMLMGTHGDAQTIAHSQEYYEAHRKFYEKFEEFIDRISKDKKLTAMFNELDSASNAAIAAGETDYYMAGFSFGVLIGIDVMRINNLKND